MPYNIKADRRLRDIAIIKDKDEQLRRFRELLGDMRFELNDELN